MTAAFGGNVPLYEEHDARVAAGYTLPGWAKLSARDRAFEVAHYRLRNMVTAHANEEASKKSNRKIKKR